MGIGVHDSHTASVQAIFYAPCICPGHGTFPVQERNLHLVCRPYLQKPVGSRESLKGHVLRCNALYSRDVDCVPPSPRQRKHKPQPCRCRGQCDYNTLGQRMRYGVVAYGGHSTAASYGCNVRSLYVRFLLYVFQRETLATPSVVEVHLSLRPPRPLCSKGELVFCFGLRFVVPGTVPPLFVQVWSLRLV